MISSREKDKRVDQQQHRVFERRCFAAEQFTREMGQQEEQEYRRLKDENGAAFLVMIVFVVPGPEEQLCAVVRNRAEAAPVLEQRQSAGVEHDEIRKERAILI